MKFIFLLYDIKMPRNYRWRTHRSQLMGVNTYTNPDDTGRRTKRKTRPAPKANNRRKRGRPRGSKNRKRPYEWYNPRFFSKKQVQNFAKNATRAIKIGKDVRAFMRALDVIKI